MATLTCLQTVIKNVSGAPLHLSFLPPHGRTLANNEEYAVTGDLIDIVRSGRAGRRRLESLDKLVQGGKLIIKTTPAAIILDSAGNPKTLVESLGNPALANPCSV